MFKLTFLGTSAGMPTKYRNVTSLAVQPGLSRDWWMVDCGEATQHRLQHVPLTVHDLAGICITHVHGDHSYGLPGLLASAAMGGRKRPLVLIAPRAVQITVAPDPGAAVASPRTRRNKGCSANDSASSRNSPRRVRNVLMAP